MIGKALNIAWLALIAAAVLWAAPFWAQKPYTSWNEKEVEKILSDSPWSRAASIDLDFSGAPTGGPEGGMRGPGMGGPGMGGPGMPRPGMGSPGSGEGMPQLQATVMWRSALPVRQAMYRAAQLSEAPSLADLERQIGEEPPHHVIAVMGLPGGPGGPGARRPPEGQTLSGEQREEMRKRMEERMLENTFLQIGDAKLAPEKMETALSGERRILVFYFPKEGPLTAKEKSANFETRVGPLKISARFKPKDMVLPMPD